MTGLRSPENQEPPGFSPGRKLTAADYRQTPEGPPWFELVDGALLAEASPTSAHQRAFGELFGVMWNWCKRTRAGEVFGAPLDVYLSDHDVLQPDILYVSAARRSIVRKDGVHGPPDLVVEVLSPSNAKFVRTKKKAAYVYGRVPEFWLVDPLIAAVHVYDFALNSALPVRFVGLGEILSSPQLPGLEVQVSELFARR